MITGDHIRMIRGALRLSLREFAALAGLAFKTVHNIERGAKAQSGTRDKIRSAFAEYVEFIEPIEGVRGAGIVMKWGVQPIGDASDESTARGEGKTGEGLDSRAWDYDFEDSAVPVDPDFPPLEITEEMRDQIREYLKEANMSPRGKALLAKSMRL